MNTRTAATGAVIALALLAGCATGESRLYGVTRESPLDVSKVELTDVTAAENRAGAPITEEGNIRFEAADGRLLLVYFGFTHCPDLCPATLADLRVALLDVDNAQQVDLVFVTVDPRRDTPEVLNNYLPYFSDRFHAVRAYEPNLKRAADAFLVRYAVTESPDGEVDVSHTAVLYAVDSSGLVRVEWPFGTAAKELASDLNTLLEDI